MATRFLSFHFESPGIDQGGFHLLGPGRWGGGFSVVFESSFSRVINECLLELIKISEEGWRGEFQGWQNPWRGDSCMSSGP